MALSKRSTLLVLSVIAALAAEVGCGDGRNSSTPVSRRIPMTAKASTQLDAKNAKDKGTTVGGALGKTGAAAAPSANADVARVEGEETDFRAKLGAQIPKEQLPNAAYTLATVTAYFSYTKKAEVFRALHSSKASFDGTGYVLQADPKSSTDVAGMMVSEIDDGRDLSVPVTMTVANAQVANDPKPFPATVFSRIVSNKPADTLKPNNDVAASVLKLLTTGTPSASAGGALDLKDGGVEVTLRLYKPDENSVGMFVSFDEKIEAQGATSTVIRNIYLVYTIKGGAAPAKKADATSPPAGPADPAAAPASEAAQTAPAADSPAADSRN